MPQNKYFIVGDLRLQYFDHPYNNTKVNERTVEVPLGLWFGEKFNAFNQNMYFMEVGAVLPYYITTQHYVVDLFDPYPYSRKLDALTVNYKTANVVSISTIEHIGTSDYGATPSDPHNAFKCLQKIVTEAPNYLVTWPIGYNKVLDQDLFNSAIPFKILERIDEDNNWEPLGEVPREYIFQYEYSKPYTCGNAIVIVSNLQEIMNGTA